jgi:hypothetical protein
MAAGELSVAEMKKRIEAGNVISYRGRIIKNVRDLPREEEHATTLEEKVMAARKLQREIDEREQQLAPLMRDIHTAQGQGQGQQPPPHQGNTSSAAAPITQPQQTNTSSVTLGNQQEVTSSTATSEANVLPDTTGGNADQEVHPEGNTVNDQQTAPQTQPAKGNTAPAAADPKFLKKPLSYWRDLTVQAENEQAARQLITKQGANEQATQQIIDALKAKPAAAS